MCKNMQKKKKINSNLLLHTERRCVMPLIRRSGQSQPREGAEHAHGSCYPQAAPGTILIFPQGVRLPHGHPGLRQKGAGKPRDALQEQHPSALGYQRALLQVPGCFRAAAWVQLAQAAPAPCTDFPAVCRKSWLPAIWPGPVCTPPRGCGSPPVAHRAAHGSAAIPRVPFAFPR